MSIQFRAAQSEYLTSVSTFTPPVNSTVCFWMYPTSVTGIRRIIGNDNLWEIRLNGTQLLNELHQGTTFGSITVFAVNTLYHVACTRASATSNGQIFVNGVIDNTGVGTQTGSPGTNNLSIGTRTGATDYYDGYVSDVRIYNAVLSAGEIGTIYAARGVDYIVQDMIHRWVFDQQSPGDLSTNVQDEGIGQLTMAPTNTPRIEINTEVTTMRRWN